MTLAENTLLNGFSDEFKETLKGDREVGNFLQDAVDNFDDSQRSEAINKLKQVSKEFKTAAQSLSGGNAASLASTVGVTSQTTGTEQTGALSVQSTETIASTTSTTHESGLVEDTTEGLSVAQNAAISADLNPKIPSPQPMTSDTV